MSGEVPGASPRPTVDSTRARGVAICGGRDVNVAVLTDSAAALAPDFAREHGVIVVPLWLTVDGRVARDGTVPLESVLAARTTTTAGPSPGEYLAAIEASGADSAVIVTVAAALSATADAARLAAAVAQVPVEVVDSGTAAGAQGLVALAASRSATSGATLDVVAARARSVARRVQLIATIPNLDRIARSGRVPGAAAWTASRLSIQPCFRLQSGRITRMRPGLGRDGGVERILASFRASIGDEPLRVCVMDAGRASEADAILSAVVGEARPTFAYRSSFGAAIAAHTGEGVLGIAWHTET